MHPGCDFAAILGVASHACVESSNCTWASHASEIPFVFGNPYTGYVNNTNKACPFSPAEEILSERIQDAWGSIARSDDPGPAWPSYEAGAMSTMIFTLPGPTVATAHKQEICAWWKSHQDDLNLDLNLNLDLDLDTDSVHQADRLEIDSFANEATTQPAFNTMPIGHRLYTYAKNWTQGLRDFNTNGGTRQAISQVNAYGGWFSRDKIAFSINCSSAASGGGRHPYHQRRPCRHNSATESAGQHRQVCEVPFFCASRRESERPA